MINESLAEAKKASFEKISFFMSLFQTLLSLKTDSNFDDAYICFNDSGELEIYIFTFEENFETEDIIIKKVTDWEQTYHYFPEIYIRQSQDKLNVLPREVMKICQ